MRYPGFVLTGVFFAIACVSSPAVNKPPGAAAEWTLRVQAGAPLPARPVEVMLLGTFHFAQLDTGRVDVLSPGRQREIEQVADALTRFGPDKIFVERQPFFWQRAFDSTYALYRAGQWVLPRNEIYQLGYRVARRLGHDRVYAGDHAGWWLGDSVRSVAARLGQASILNGTAPHTIKNVHEVLDDDDLLAAGATIGDVLHWMNTPEYHLRVQNGYFARNARVGNDSVAAGPDLVAEWYRRNIKIYRTIIDRLDYSERRILVIIGNDHVPPLEHFFASNANFRPVQAFAHLQP
jgi:hypothetical protein